MRGIDLRRMPVFRVLIPFACGVALGSQSGIPAWPSWWAPALVVVWILQSFLYFRCLRTASACPLPYIITAAGLFLGCGIWTGAYTRPADPRWPAGEEIWVRVEVQSPPEMVSGEWRLTGRSDLLCSGAGCMSAKGLLYICCQDPDGGSPPEPGEIWVFGGKLYPIRNSGNPGDPDYEAIMHRKNCWYRLYSHACFRSEEAAGFPLSWRRRALQLREKLSSPWEGDRESVMLLRAVCLGDRSGLSQELEDNFAHAGGMHLLAVSGLHIGLIWWVLRRALFWMTLLARGEVWRGCTILAILWGYASITGFSSPVCRTVTMFSFFTLGQMIDRRSHPVNAILVSAVLLLMISPQRLAEAGFQLSFSAILGIAVLFPVLRGFLHPGNLIWKWIWEASCVSLSAQLSTAPLVIHYFHQIPVFSILTSLWAIPLLSLLITLFVASAPVVLAGLPAEMFHHVMVWLAGLMNRGMELVSRLPGAVASELHLDGPAMILWMIVLWSGIVSLQRKSLMTGLFCLAVTGLLCLHGAINRQRVRNDSGLMVPHFYGGTQVSLWRGRRADHYRWGVHPATDQYMDLQRDRMWRSRSFHHSVGHMDSLLISSGRISSCVRVSEAIWVAGNDHVKCLVVRGSHASPPARQFYLMALQEVSCRWRFDLVLLSGEPAVGPFRALTSGDLVTDGSSHRNFPEDSVWRRTPLHSTYEKGAFLKRW